MSTLKLHHRAIRSVLLWTLALLAGAILGAAASFVMPASFPPAADPAMQHARAEGAGSDHGASQAHQPVALDHGSPAPEIKPFMVMPFALMLLAIAFVPLVSARWWHRYYPAVACLLAGLVLGYYLAAFGAYGRTAMLHAAVDYLGFFALVGGLYVVSGSVNLHITGRSGPLVNAAILGIGALLANVIGTTGASMMLIRPFMRVNKGRLRPLHIVFFIFIISNCGGCLTPIGDPPLFLGFLKGVPFMWTITHLWQRWLLVNSALLLTFLVMDTLIDRRHAPREASGATRVSIEGRAGLVGLALIVGAVFIAPALRPQGELLGISIGAAVQIAVCIISWRNTPARIHEANDFNFLPVKEVGLLFLGIFTTMAPALGYLEAHGSSLGVYSPSQFYFTTGLLSAVLDNAPTQLSFFQVALGSARLGLSPADIHSFLNSAHAVHPADGSPPMSISGAALYSAISTGAVFFGAMTYIGNGPNFMVKSIAESRGLRMPGFFAYFGLAVAFLLPVLVLNWLVFIR